MTPTHSLASPPAALEEEIDQELLDLPAPPRRERSLTVGLLLVTALASVAMVLMLRRDAVYAFAPAEAAELGDVGAPAARAALVENRLVTAKAMLGAGHAIRYERPLVSGSFRLMPVVPREGGPAVWAEVHVPDGAENARWIPPESLEGRLERFATAGPKHRGLADAVLATTGARVPDDAWLLVQGETPARAKSALLLTLMFAGFAAWNVYAAAKLVRRVR